MKTILRKITAFAVVLSMLMPLGANALGVSFRQDNDSNYFKYINGFEDGTVRPDGVLTRAQGAKMLYYVLNLELAGKGRKSFSDVPQSFWGYSAISALSDAGIINGYAGNVFKPNKGLTRAEFATIVARAMGIKVAGKKTKAFKDVGGHWAEGSIAALSENKFIGGYGDGTFRPNSYLTRAEAVKMINKAVRMEVKIQVEKQKFSDLKPSHWAYFEIMAAASSTALEIAPDRKAVKFSDISYPSLAKTDFIAQKDALVEEFKIADTKRKAEIFSELTKLQLGINTAVTMASINVKRDVTNAEYKAEYAKIPQAQKVLTEIYIAQYDALKAAPDRDAVCQKIGIEFKNLLPPSAPMEQKILDLFNRETEYVSEFSELYNTPSISYKGNKYSLYQAVYSGESELRELGLDYYVQKESVLNNIFDKLVKVRTEIAKYYNCNNYYEVAYGYYEDNIRAFRDDVKKYLVPLYNDIRRAQYAMIYPEIEKNDYEFPDMSFLSGSTDYIGKIKDVMRDLSPQTRQAIEYIIEYDMIDSENRENKSPGAFTVYFNQYETPFMYMRSEGGYEDVSTFSHEFGHVFQNFRWYGKNPTDNIPLDVAETASTAMELLLSKRYDEFFGDNAKDAEKYVIYNFLAQIIDSCMLDEFQTEIYKNPNMTPDARNKLYRKIDEEYFGEYSSSAHQAYLKGLVWSNATHIYEVPFYMIEYALSSAVSLQIWEVSKTNFDQAFEKYMSIIESRYVRFGLAALTLGAELENPFSEGTMESVAGIIKALFKRAQ